MDFDDDKCDQIFFKAVTDKVATEEEFLRALPCFLLLALMMNAFQAPVLVPHVWRFSWVVTPGVLACAQMCPGYSDVVKHPVWLEQIGCAEASGGLCADPERSRYNNALLPSLIGPCRTA